MANMNQISVDFIKNESVYDLNLTTTVSSSLSQVHDSSHTYNLVTFYLMGVGGMTVCCLGIIGNILSFVVLTRKTMKSSTYTYLSGLAVCDLLVLVTSVLMFHKDVKYPERGVIYWTDNYYSEMFPIVHPLAVTFQITSVWLTLAFTVDRYIMICHPFKAERMCDISRARRVVLALYLGGVIFNIPRFLEYETDTIELPNNITRIFTKFTELGQNEYFKTTVHLWLYFIFVCLIPFFTMAILNAFLIHAVHQSRKRGKAINAKEKRRNDTTVMLIGVIIIFFICQTPALISRMMWSLPTTVTSTRYRLLNEIGNFLVILNSATNIIPYYFFGQRFRNEFWRSFCFCFIGKENVRRLARSMSLSFDRRFSNASTIVRAIELNGLPTHDGQRSQKDSGASAQQRDGTNGTALVLDQHKTRTVLLSKYNNSDRLNLWTSLKQKLLPKDKRQPATDIGIGIMDGDMEYSGGSGNGSIISGGSIGMYDDGGCDDDDGGVGYSDNCGEGGGGGGGGGDDGGDDGGGGGGNSSNTQGSHQQHQQHPHQHHHHHHQQQQQQQQQQQHHHHHRHQHQEHRHSGKKSRYNFKPRQLTSLCLRYQKTDGTI